MANPHDALFRYVFSQPEHAASLLQALLPSTLTARCDWSTLAPRSTTFVDQQLRGREADLLFSVSLEGRQSYVYVLLEHQSSNDALMPFRLLRYMVRIWEAHLQEVAEIAAEQHLASSQRLPPILPVVVHHSNSGWRAPTDFSALLDVDAETLTELLPHVPQFRFVLDDLSHLDDAALRGRSLSALTTAGLLLLTHGRSSANLLEDLARWTDVLRRVLDSRHGLEALSAVLRYALLWVRWPLKGYGPWHNSSDPIQKRHS